MADQSASTRPRRSAAVEAQLKVEESYEIWGQPPSDNEMKHSTPGRKRSAITETSAGRKRKGTFVQHRDERGTPTVIAKTEAADDTPTQPVKSATGRSKKNQPGRQTLVEAEEPTKKITLKGPNSPAFKEALRQIRDTEESTGTFAGSHLAGPTVIIESIATNAAADYSTQSESQNVTGAEQTSSVPPDVSKPFSVQAPASSESETESAHDGVQRQVPDILQNDPQTDSSGPGAETITADSLKEATRFRTPNLELLGAPSEFEVSRGGSDHTDWLEQLETAASVQEGERPAVRPSKTAPSSICEHTHLGLGLSSSAVQTPSGFAGTYHFGAHSLSEYVRQKTVAVSLEPDQNAATLSAFPERATVSNKHALRALGASPVIPTALFTTQQAQTLHGGKPFSNEFSSKIEQTQMLHKDRLSFPRFAHEKLEWSEVAHMSDSKHTTEKASSTKNADLESISPERSQQTSRISRKAPQLHYEQDADNLFVVHKPIHTGLDRLRVVSRPERGVGNLGFQHKLGSAHPPPINRQAPNIYFDRNPQGSSVGTHSFDPLVGLPDHSDPRTFYTPCSKDWPHVLAALQPSINHFRQLTNGAKPREIPLDSGYEVAHTLLQAHLRFWFVINRPEFAHENAIPKLFKLERWEGGIEHWKFATNSPVGFITTRAESPGLTFSVSSNVTSSSSG